ncbi:hypothetical protein KIL84_019748 [Mauremys mutica]|uniref:Uncharacterized protein n=1 Tax=Mauremys mutica TaxID=74926 RepID=A0A9D3XSU3_9SAUR|nr:hypothetical protein KIL84_019748 [Mauremys mutica]
MGNCLPKISRESRAYLRRRRRSHQHAQAHRGAPAAAKSYMGAPIVDQNPAMDNLEETDLTHPNEICYATINHSLKEKPAIINCDHETEYAFVSMPAKKVTFTSHQDNVYDYVLIS